MNRSLLLLIAFLICWSCAKEDPLVDPSLIDPPVTSNSPNILLLIADDMGLDATPGYSEGVEKPAMPNLQSLIDAGVTFRNLWAAPTCTPTRATILTGKYGIKTGVLEVGNELSTSETSLQAYLDQNTAKSYAHSVIGKWHLSTDEAHPNEMGIDYFAGFLRGGVQSYRDWPLIENQISTTSTDYTTTKLTDLAIDWIGVQDKPWFLWLAYNAAHTPFHLPPDNLHTRGNLPSDQASIDANPLPYYLAMLEAMDTEIGRLLASMSDEERANTVIVFIGDNGTPNQVAQAPYRSNRAKGTIYQGGINVPMIVAGQGVDRMGEVEDALINTTDLFATIADIAGTGTTTIHSSVSFKPLLFDASAEKRSYVYSEIEGQNNNGYTIRDETFKVIIFNNGEERFYNLKEDPYETTNLLNAGLSEVELQAKENLVAQARALRE